MLSSVVVVCVRQAGVTFSLVRLVGVSLHAGVRKDRKEQKRFFAPGKSQPAVAICCLALVNIS